MILLDDDCTVVTWTFFCFSKKIGFIKPVGQQHVPVQTNKGNTVRVDKDVELIKEHFHLDHLDYESMSPIIIPSGYTKDYVDGKISFQAQVKDLQAAMHHVSQASDITVLEGTGHCAVGSIVGLNNAKAASLLGADMVRTGFQPLHMCHNASKFPFSLNH